MNPPLIKNVVLCEKYANGYLVRAIYSFFKEAKKTPSQQISKAQLIKDESDSGKYFSCLRSFCFNKEKTEGFHLNKRHHNVILYMN